MSGTRRPAVAGMFYPAEAGALTAAVRAYLEDVEPRGAPKALIVPHAGYVYSGPVAASGYRCLDSVRESVRRVVLIGPSHRVPFPGIAVPTATSFATPLGEVPLDREAIDALVELPFVAYRDRAHAPEHSLEVHLPFLQVALDAFQLVPLLCGDASAAEVAEALEAVWGGDETLVVVSTDLSHYHDYETARTLDEETATAIEAGRPEALHGSRACGYVGVRGLLEVARRRGLAVERLDLRSSGDTAGPRDQVVGYGAWMVPHAV